MEQYQINGKTVSYDTFDLDNLAYYEQAARQTAAQMQTLSEQVTDDNALDVLRQMCEEITSFFDAVLGDGMAHELFGDRLNVKTLGQAYTDFVRAVETEKEKFAGHGLPALPQLSRTSSVRRASLVKPDAGETI